jgi:dCMP deaminase
MNALLQCAYHGVESGGSTMYCTSVPCSLCSKMIINAGVERVVYLGDYPDDLGRELLSEAGVELSRAEQG